MFWEIMDYVHTHDNHDGGFVLWLESDMVPIRSNWLDRLDEEWRTIERPLVLGRLVTNFPDYLGGAPVPPHINGGACYAKDLAAVIPSPPGRGLPFDMAMFPTIASSGRGWRTTEQFAFASPTEASALAQIFRNNHSSWPWTRKGRVRCLRAYLATRTAGVDATCASLPMAGSRSILGATCRMPSVTVDATRGMLVCGVGFH